MTYKRLIRIIIAALAAISVSAGPAVADIYGGTDSVMILKLTSIYNKLKEYYESNLQILQQAKMQSDNLKNMTKLAQEAKQEYDFCANFSIQRELKKIQGDIEGLTNLDNLDGKTPEQVFKLLKAEIDRRFRYGTAEEKEKAAELKTHLETLERLNELKKAKTEEAVSVGTANQSQKDYLSSIASSCALISSLELAAEQRRKESELARDNMTINEENLVESFDEALGKMK